MTTATIERITETDMFALLHKRFSVEGDSGRRYVVAEHVRNTTGYSQRVRTCDFMALDTWPSGDLALHGIEVKTNRPDWLRELKEPEKADEFMKLVDYWWLAAPLGVARLDELPAGWGMMLAQDDEAKRTTLFNYDEPWTWTRTLRVARQAPRLTQRSGPLPRQFMTALMRATAKTASRES